MKVLMLVLGLMTCPAMAVAPELSEPITTDGLTIRDQVAVEAMNALIMRFGINMGPESIAKWAYMYADAMMAARRQNAN